MASTSPRPITAIIVLMLLTAGFSGATPVVPTTVTGGPSFTPDPDGQYALTKTIDGNTATYWYGSAQADEWSLVFDLGIRKFIDTVQIKFHPRSQGGTSVPQETDVMTSNDRINFDTVAAVTDGSKDDHTVAVLTNARYLKLEMHGKSPAPANSPPKVDEVLFDASAATQSGLDPLEYRSSFDNTLLKAEAGYIKDGTRKPLVIVMHGWSGGVSNVGNTVKWLRDHGVFALSVAMRGRDGSEGTPDAGRIEIHDIYDAIPAAIAKYPEEIDADNVNIIGFSGGGGNTFSAVTKMPDSFRVAASFFGMSDYEYWMTHGAGSARAAQVVEWTGGTPAQYPARYASSRSLSGFANNPWTKFHLFWDEKESICPPYFNKEWISKSTALGYRNTVAHESKATASQRWIHGYPVAGDSNMWAIEQLLLPEITAKTTMPSVPASGSPKFRVLGFLLTKNFKIYLGDAKSAAADLAYTYTPTKIEFELSNPTSENPAATAKIIVPLNGRTIAGIVGGTGTVNQGVLTITDIPLNGKTTVELQPLALVTNGGFEDAFTGWTLGDALSLGGASIVTADCVTGKCARITGFIRPNPAPTPRPTELGTLVQIHPQLGHNQLVSFKFKANQAVRLTAALYDLDWKATCKSPSAAKSFFSINLQGNGSWINVARLYDTTQIPIVDGCSEPTKNHRWKLIFTSPTGASSQAVLIDDVSVEEISSPECRSFNQYQDGTPMPCPEGNFRLESAPATWRISGNASISTDNELAYTVRPLTLYRVSAEFRITDRKCRYALDYEYPDYRLRSESQSYSNGVFCGEIHAYAYEPTTNNKTDLLSTPWAVDSPVMNSNVDWFTNTIYVKTPRDANSLSLKFVTHAFDGVLSVRNIVVEEAESVVEDYHLETPIATQFGGMKIARVSTSPFIVSTNAADFSFTSNAILFEQGGVPVGRIYFPENFLSGLTRIKPELSGVVVLENANIKLSIGADSAMTARLKATSTTVSVSGPEPEYHAFEAGVIFTTDFKRGMFFSQVLPTNVNRNMPYGFDGSAMKYIYPEGSVASYLPAYGYPNWNIVAPFTGNWQVNYQLSRGDAFIAAAFPPKKFNETAYCKERHFSNNMFGLMPNYQRQDATTQEYALQAITETKNVVLLWISNYPQSAYRFEPVYYYTNGSTLVSSAMCSGLDANDACNNRSVKRNLAAQYDSHGPYLMTAQNQAFLRSTIDSAHARGIKVIAYTTPSYFYAQNATEYLAEMSRMKEEYGFDGVYYDGLFESKPLESLLLVRGTRDLFPDGYYVQHNSGDPQFLPAYVHNHRAPFIDAWANELIVGEGFSRADDDTWLLHYCNANISNTPPGLKVKLRPINRTLTSAENLENLLTWEEQTDKQLACGGLMRTFPQAYSSQVTDPAIPGYKQYTNMQYYEDRINEKCLPVTCGDGTCDIGEKPTTCPLDCAPQSATERVTIDKGIAACSTPQSVAQWVLEGRPLYGIHYTFDGSIARDDSGNNLHPDANVGYSYAAPLPETDGNVKAFRFSSQAYLRAPTDNKLGLNGPEFSVFTAFKADTNTGIPMLFLYNQTRLGLSANKAYAEFNTPTGRVTLTGTQALSAGWHTLGIVHAADNTIVLYADGVRAASSRATLGPSPDYGTFFIGSNFNGLIDDLFTAPRAFSAEQALNYHETLNKHIAAPADAACITTDGNGRYNTAIPTAPNPTTSFDIARGWNLVGVPEKAITGSVQTDCAIPYQYYYDAAARRYAEADLTATQPKGAGMWVYETEACTISMQEDPMAAPVARQLKQGWNIVALGRNAGAEFEAILGSCNVATAYGYDPTANVYYRVTTASQLAPGGYWVKARADCTV